MKTHLNLYVEDSSLTSLRVSGVNNISLFFEECIGQYLKSKLNPKTDLNKLKFELDNIRLSLENIKTEKKRLLQLEEDNETALLVVSNSIKEKKLAEENEKQKLIKNEENKTIFNFRCDNCGIIKTDGTELKSMKVKDHKIQICKGCFLILHLDEMNNIINSKWFLERLNISLISS